jgi:hypothetical protein
VLRSQTGFLEDLDAEGEINTVWEKIIENIKISTKESRLLSTEDAWFDEGCSELLYKRKQPKLQRLQDPSEINRDILNNVRYEGN